MQSKQDKIWEEANFFLDEANNAMFASKVKEARTFARRAFQLAPHLREDDIARDVAVYVMKMPADDAIDLLLSDRDLFEVDRKFRKQMGYAYSDESWFDRLRAYYRKWDVTWTDVAIDVVLYVIVIMLPIFILLLLASTVLAGSVAQMAASQVTGQTAVIQAGLDEIGYGELALGLGVMFTVTGIVGFVIFLSFAFQMALTHFSANFFLGGNGSFRRLVHHSLVPIGLYIGYIWFIVFITPVLYAIGLGSLVQSGMLDIASMIGFGVFAFGLSNSIGRAYEFDFGHGCLSLLFPYIVLFSFGCLIITLRFGTEMRQLFMGR